MSFSLLPALLFSLGMMIADYHYHKLDKVRMTISCVTTPIQYVVDAPVRFIGWARTLISSRLELIDENMQLRYKQTILEAELQRLSALKAENSQLKALLQTTTPSETKVMASEILAVEVSPARQVVVLNKGIREGVFVGQAVLDAKGVMGQIIDVGFMTSTVLLISDAKSAVPVRNNRTGERAILVGENEISSLALINLPKSSTIETGDLLVTSGLGGRYPEGYPVGLVTDVKNIPGEDFITVSVEPMASLNRSRLALLIWPSEDRELLNHQITERMTIIKEMS